MKNRVTCEICGSSFDPRGLAGHVRLSHPESPEGISRSPKKSQVSPGGLKKKTQELLTNLEKKTQELPTNLEKKTPDLRIYETVKPAKTLKKITGKKAVPAPVEAPVEAPASENNGNSGRGNLLAIAGLVSLIGIFFVRIFPVDDEGSVSSKKDGNFSTTPKADSFSFKNQFGGK